MNENMREAIEARLTEIRAAEVDECMGELYRLIPCDVIAPLIDIAEAALAETVAEDAWHRFWDDAPDALDEDDAMLEEAMATAWDACKDARRAALAALGGDR